MNSHIRIEVGFTCRFRTILSVGKYTPRNTFTFDVVGLRSRSVTCHYELISIIIELNETNGEECQLIPWNYPTLTSSNDKKRIVSLFMAFMTNIFTSTAAGMCKRHTVCVCVFAVPRNMKFVSEQSKNKQTNSHTENTEIKKQISNRKRPTKTRAISIFSPPRDSTNPREKAATHDLSANEVHKLMSSCYSFLSFLSSSLFIIVTSFFAACFFAARKPQ